MSLLPVPAPCRTSRNVCDEAKASLCAVERVADGGRVPAAAALRGGDAIRVAREGRTGHEPQLILAVAGGGDAAVTKALLDLDLGLDLLDGLLAGLFVISAAIGLKRTNSIPPGLLGPGSS